MVQCFNRGTDGRSIQWECKAEMENSVRFGKLEVFCEGYNYPEDPYILVGSCCLEYNLELTKEGKKRRGGSTNSYDASSQWSWLTLFFWFAVIVVVVYAVYQTCVYNTPSKEDEESEVSSGGIRGGGWVGPMDTQRPQAARQPRKKRTSEGGRGKTSLSSSGAWTFSEFGGIGAPASSGTRVASGFGGTRGH